MTSHNAKPFSDDMLQITIKQVVDEGLDVSAGSISIADIKPDHSFPAYVEGCGDYIQITVNGGWGDTRQGVALTETPCHYGGTRKWFLCPSCRRRCGVLYIHTSIACRKCHDLVYESQYEPAQDRMLRQLKKIRRVIGCDDDIRGPFNPPPHSMSKRRWEMMIEEFLELRDKFLLESEHPKKWRNDAPKASHWKVGARVPVGQTN